MAEFKEMDTLILAGYGYDAAGPHLVLNTRDEQRQYRYAVADQVFSLERSFRRYCVGRFDLESFQTETCPLQVELLQDAKDTSCPACLEATGFNPSFYFASNVSAKQRAYNETPHYVYMVYFSPQHIKVGISAEARGIERLLEQGARAALILGRFPNADQARTLESDLCSQEGIYETMRASKKRELFCEQPYSFEEASQVLHEAADRYNLKPLAISELVPKAVGDVLDLTPYYFTQAPEAGQIEIPSEEYDQICGGHCVGMIGSNLVFKQESTYFVASIGPWVSYEVRLVPNEIIKAYELSPTQMTLM